jgi:putative restriction endonuclease
MSTRDTTILNKNDLRYLLIDSLKLYSDNVNFIDGNNPYRFSINKKVFYVLIRNVHESGNGRKNQDECSVQLSNSKGFVQSLNSQIDTVILGYFADEKVFTAWDPRFQNDRFGVGFKSETKPCNVRIYSRFSKQTEAAQKNIAAYRDNKEQSIISFKPEYLGLYLENIQTIHQLSDEKLIELVKKSDSLNDENLDGLFDTSEGVLTITHARQKRDPNFRRKIYDAYNHKCAMCGIGLELIEAAHIIPHSHELGTDEVDNGISLCALHHTAYDRSLIYFDQSLNIKINENKIEYLEKVGLDSGIRKFEKLAFDKILTPDNHILRPNKGNIKIANQTRGIIT